MGTSESQKVLYFAHAVNMYSTPLEEAALKLIAMVFPGVTVENPNQPKHQAGYTAYAKRARESSTSHKGMNYFFDEVLPHCDGCVAMPFLDGKMGLGVAGEVKWFIEQGKPVWGLLPARWMNPEARLDQFIENHQNGLFYIRPLIAEEMTKILKSDPALVVPHEETRLRTWVIYNRERRPYDTAHRVSLPIPEGFYPEEKKS